MGPDSKKIAMRFATVSIDYEHVNVLQGFCVEALAVGDLFQEPT